MAPYADPQVPTLLEREAVRIAISSVPEPERRAALERQLDVLRVRDREFTGVGFYTYFTCPEELRSAALPDEANHHPAAFSMDRPKHPEALWFLVYTRNGLIDYLEGVSSGSWYEEFASTGRWQESDELIVFDPTHIELG